MMQTTEKLILKVSPREQTGKKVAVLRGQGLLPAVLYGADEKPTSVAISYIEFVKIYKKAGGSTLVELDLSGKKVNTLVAEIQINPATRRYIHADFKAVKMTEKITATVPLVFVGEAPAVEEQDGTLVKNLDEVEVSCLPGDLPHEIEVDIAGLVDFDASIHVSNIKAPQGVEILDDGEETVALVEPPRSEEELAALEEAPVEEVGAVEVEGEDLSVQAGKAEGEEGEEGVPAEGEKVVPEKPGSKEEAPKE